MVKSKARVQQKMAERVRTAGAELKAGMQEAPNPIDVALKDVNAHVKKMQDGLAEAARTGRIGIGLKRAKERGSWEKSFDRAAQNYEAAADRMVENAMEDYDARAAAIQRALDKVKGMPRITTAQKIAYGAAYQQAVHEEFNKLYGRTG